MRESDRLVQLSVALQRVVPYGRGCNLATALRCALLRLLHTSNAYALVRAGADIKLRGAGYYYAAFDVPHTHDCIELSSKEPLTGRVFAVRISPIKHI